MSSAFETIQPGRDSRVTLKAKTRLEGSQTRPELDPLRRVLAALSDSLAATYRGEAARAGIPLTEIDVRVEAGLDLAASPLGHLRVDIRLRSSADINDLDQLRARAEQSDSVLALLRQAVPTRLEIGLDLRDTRSIAA
jgi:uncharacterized OsmC-like protein